MLSLSPFVASGDSKSDWKMSEMDKSRLLLCSISFMSFSLSPLQQLPFGSVTLHVFVPNSENKEVLEIAL